MPLAVSLAPQKQQQQHTHSRQFPAEWAWIYTFAAFSKICIFNRLNVRQCAGHCRRRASLCVCVCLCLSAEESNSSANCCKVCKDWEVAHLERKGPGKAGLLLVPLKLSGCPSCHHHHHHHHQRAPWHDFKWLNIFLAGRYLIKSESNTGLHFFLLTRVDLARGKPTTALCNYYSLWSLPPIGNESLEQRQHQQRTARPTVEFLDTDANTAVVERGCIVLRLNEWSLRPQHKHTISHFFSGLSFHHHHHHQCTSAPRPVHSSLRPHPPFDSGNSGNWCLSDIYGSDSLWKWKPNEPTICGKAVRLPPELRPPPSSSSPPPPPSTKTTKSAALRKTRNEMWKFNWKLTAKRIFN